MFDSTAAGDRLHRISKTQLVRFLSGPDKGDLYGFGFYCDAYEGTVYLVANTEQFYLSSLRDFEARFGLTDPEVLKWHTGDWQFPGGLLPSSSPEQREFHDAWEEYQELLFQIENDNKQQMLEDVGFEVLRRLIHGGAFAAAVNLEGFMIQGPDDPQEIILEKKKRFDCLFQPADQ